MIDHLEPKAVWTHFQALNNVPRASKKEEQVIQFALDFGQSLGLETFKDTVGNVIIRKPATAGMEDRKKLVLQSHLDMVHQKNNDTVFDFDTQGIEMFIEEDWVKAKGTTLGADNVPVFCFGRSACGTFSRAPAVGLSALAFDLLLRVGQRAQTIAPIPSARKNGLRKRGSDYLT